MKEEKGQFGSRSEETPSKYNKVYEGIIGRSLQTSCIHHSSIIGTLKGFVQRLGVDYALFNPSIVYSPDGTAHVGKKIPSELIMPFDAVRSLRPSNLSKWIKEYNNEIERKKEKGKI